MLKRVTINLASTCDQEPCLDSFGESEHVHCANHICLDMMVLTGLYL
ncbi:hypothetical protein HanXRQr2_Chr11g0514011 [Helianthus annuus]|uniref:Uncharacterized protein n=1 Tax=Helianthus annuus TaxID=4232 RepID=A0A9K3HSV2_HELAN|nr:hypothetical protein HanXRQr2_Chr11g0514011 [Helianthus annuus]KAJ0877026.1 hypothetical protein HanPSC8_Chr11g0495401 [Helianthus annuus]